MKDIDFSKVTNDRNGYPPKEEIQACSEGHDWEKMNALIFKNRLSAAEKEQLSESHLFLRKRLQRRRNRIRYNQKKTAERVEQGKKKLAQKEEEDSEGRSASAEEVDE
jgi:hypothetical protein